MFLIWPSGLTMDAWINSLPQYGQLRILRSVYLWMGSRIEVWDLDLNNIFHGLPAGLTKVAFPVHFQFPPPNARLNHTDIILLNMPKCELTLYCSDQRERNWTAVSTTLKIHIERQLTRNGYPLLRPLTCSLISRTVGVENTCGLAAAITLKKLNNRTHVNVHDYALDLSRMEAELWSYVVQD